MSKPPERFLSVAEIQSAGGTPDISFELNFPVGLDTSSLVVDVHRLSRLKRTAGVGQIVIENFQSDDERSIGGSVNSDGTIAAVTSKSQKPPSPHSGIDTREKIWSPYFIAGYRPSVRAPFNTRVVVSSLGESTAPTIEEHFENEMNDTIKRALLYGSVASNGMDSILMSIFLTKRGSVREPAMFMLPATLMSIGSVSSIILTCRYPDILAPQYVAVTAFNNLFSLMTSKKIKPEIPVEEHKWSLFNPFGFQLDRMLYAQARIRAARGVISLAS